MQYHRLHCAKLPCSEGEQLDLTTISPENAGDFKNAAYRILFPLDPSDKSIKSRIVVQRIETGVDTREHLHPASFL